MQNTATPEIDDVSGVAYKTIQIYYLTIRFEVLTLPSL